MATQVKCPVCSTLVPWIAASRWRPFCSERCKLIDLGDWASERHVVTGSAAENDDDHVGPSPNDSADPRH